MSSNKRKQRVEIRRPPLRKSPVVDRDDLGAVIADVAAPVVRELVRRELAQRDDLGAAMAAAEATPRTALDEACRGTEFLCQRLRKIGTELASEIEKRLGPMPPELPAPVPARPGIVGRLHDQLAEAHYLAARVERDLARLKSL